LRRWPPSGWCCAGGPRHVRAGAHARTCAVPFQHRRSASSAITPDGTRPDVEHEPPATSAAARPRRRRRGDPHPPHTHREADIHRRDHRAAGKLFPGFTDLPVIPNTLYDLFQKSYILMMRTDDRLTAVANLKRPPSYRSPSARC
jgi:hypothetical protein